MEKFLKITLSDAPFLIPIKNILHVEVGTDTHIQILYNTVGHTATSASQVIGLELTATTATDATKTKEQLRSFVNQIEAALQTNWTSPIYDITSKIKYPITTITQIEEEWSA
jgi:hypothetical protein